MQQSQPAYFSLSGSQRQRLKLANPPIGSGGEASIFRVEGLAGCVAKIYHTPGRGHAPRAKLEAMLVRPPQIRLAQVNGESLPLFAWPTHLIEDQKGECAGFLMPELPIRKAVTLVRYMARSVMHKSLSPEDCSLPRRVMVGRNLAAVLAEMHRQEHYFVDIKPENIYMFKDTGMVSLVDNDSFSIAAHAGGTRFPATAFSPEYMAPELLRNNMPANSVVNDTQDRFALAVLIFKILNYGVHPFQGRPQIQTDEWNIDLCVTEGYYPHSLLQPHPAVAPSPTSVHDCWDTGTRRLFDRAFTSKPSQRPSAEEWRDHLESLQDQRTSAFTRCSVKPNEVQHIHFAGKLCPECRLDDLSAGRTPARQPPPSRPSPSAPPPPSHPSKPAPAPAPAPVSVSTGKPSKKWPLLAVGATAVVGALIWVASNNSSSNNNPPDSSQITPIPPPPPISSPTQTAARQLSQPQDLDGIRARITITEQALQDALASNRADAMAVIAQGLAGDDAATLASAQTRVRNTAFTRHFTGWQRLRKEARKINDEELASHRSDLARAISRQTQAAALDPYDREIAGNRAFYIGLSGQSAKALDLALYTLSLPRDKATDTGRGADWQLVGAMFARLGNPRDSQGAYFVSLATTNNLPGFCKSLLHQQKIFGEALKAPIDTVFRRISERGQSSTENCAYPPAWIET